MRAPLFKANVMIGASRSKADYFREALRLLVEDVIEFLYFLPNVLNVGKLQAFGFHPLGELNKAAIELRRRHVR